MSTDEVLQVIGSLTDIADQLTGKKWIPFYFGTDTRRKYWPYRGIGCVVFSRNDCTTTEKSSGSDLRKPSALNKKTN